MEISVPDKENPHNEKAESNVKCLISSKTCFIFLAPTGAQEVKMSVRPCVLSGTLCLIRVVVIQGVRELKREAAQ